MGLLDILIILAFIAYAIYSGLGSKSVASKNLEEYFLAGRTLKGWQAGISLAATQFAADTPLLVTGLIATAGIFSLWRLWIYAIAFLMVGFLLAPSWRRTGVLTDAELTELRYGKKPAAVLRGVKALYFGTLFNCTVLAMVLLAATRIAEPFLLWQDWLPAWLFNPLVSLVAMIGVPLSVGTHTGHEMWVHSASNLISIGVIVLVTTFYSTTGGLRSVVKTDIAQFFIAMLATLLFTIVVVQKAGGLSGITEKINTLFASGGINGMTPDQILAFTPSVAYQASWAVLLVYAFQWIVQMNADGTGYIAQRSMACRTDKDAKQAAVVFTFAQVFLRSLLWLPLGLGLLVLFPPDLSLSVGVLTAEREATFVRGVSELLPTGIKGIMLTGMLAALASTVDTHLNWGSSYWTNDIYKRFVCQTWLKTTPSDRSLVWVARLANFLILGIGLLIMTQLSSIQVAWQASLLLGAGMGIMLVLRWLWWRVTAWGELACILASLVLAPVLLFAVPADQEAVRLLLMAAGSTIAGVGVSLIGGPEETKRLKAFYEKAHPPGFWGPISSQFGARPIEDVKNFWRMTAATLLASFSIFCLLTGIGSWICHSPAPAWFPWTSAWNPLLITLGLGLIPVWYKLGFKETDKEKAPSFPMESMIASFKEKNPS